MYEADGEPADGFHPETLKRMRELFAGRTCAACPAPAARLSGDQFYCHEHYSRAKRAPRTQRVCHCALAVDA